jgi:hypothetical protein
MRSSNEPAPCQTAHEIANRETIGASDAPAARTSFAAEPSPSAVSLDCYSVNQTFAHHRKRILGSLPMSKNKADTRLPATVIEHEARADGALTVCDALHVANPMFHAISP